MINTNYDNLYGQYMNSMNNGKTNGRVRDKSKMSDNMAYLARAKAETKKARQAEQPEKSNSKATDKKADNITQEDIQKLYAKLNGINYGQYDEKDSYKSMANTFLNEMVFSHMSSSKELFIPNIGRSVLSAAFNAVYDTSNDTISGRQNFDTDESDTTEDING